LSLCDEAGPIRERGMAKELKAGDKVSWDSSGGHVAGKVVRKQTTPTNIKNHKVTASKDSPQYIVKSDKSGKQAAHKPSELKKA
jgi:Hypervirulence associated proteins TUDOR domain